MPPILSTPALYRRQNTSSCQCFQCLPSQLSMPDHTTNILFIYHGGAIVLFGGKRVRWGTTVGQAQVPLYPTLSSEKVNMLQWN